MADALTSDGLGLRPNAIHQFLHGYSDGHRLIEGSLKLPVDLARLMLRMSDLSGSSVVKGFERYITGYPLDAINAYALAMTWYAPEMPRPGCVWTHTLVIPMQAIASIPALGSLTHFFRRPSNNAITEQYRTALPLEVASMAVWHKKSHSNIRSPLESIFSAYYVSSPFGPVVLAAQDAEEFSDAIFALWSQQWPSLRQKLAFCTGSLSARNLPDRPFDIQCVPSALAKDVTREIASVKLTRPKGFSPNDLQSAIHDALILNGGSFRHFLWRVTEHNSRRADFVSYVKVFDAFNEQSDALALVKLIADSFPEPTEGTALKAQLLEFHDFSGHNKLTEQDVLRALATTQKYASFDLEMLWQDEWKSNLLEDSRATRQLVSDLFRANLNPFGDELLSSLIRALNAADVPNVIDGQPQLLPALVRANPDLAASPQLWAVAGDRQRELLDSVLAQEIRPEVVSRIVSALLDRGFDSSMRRVFDRWGRDSLFAALDWIDMHEGSIPEGCREALAFRVPEIMGWVLAGPERSAATLVGLAHLVAPYADRIATYDSSPWLRALRAVTQSSQDDEATYIRAFLLALALCNAPPSPVDLVSESFEGVHEAARQGRLTYEAWLVLEPLVPALGWHKNWDRCERLRRALVSAFERYHWPASELDSKVRDRDLLEQMLNSAKKVGVEDYFRT